MIGATDLVARGLLVVWAVAISANIALSIHNANARRR